LESTYDGDILLVDYWFAVESAPDGLGFRWG